MWLLFIFSTEDKPAEKTPAPALCLSYSRRMQQPATQAGLMASGCGSCNAKACHELGLTCTSSPVMLAATLSHCSYTNHLQPGRARQRQR